MDNQPTYDNGCPVLHALSVIGGKWRIPILWKLANSPLRYNELKRQLSGITNIMLTRSLKELEAYDLVRRVQYSEIPPHVEYSLTQQGEQLVPAFMIIKEWGLLISDNDEVSCGS